MFGLSVLFRELFLTKLGYAMRSNDADIRSHELGLLQLQTAKWVIDHMYLLLIVEWEQELELISSHQMKKKTC